MKIPDQEAVAYSAFECIIATADLFLLTWQGQITAFQKQNIILGNPDAFGCFLADHVNETAIISLFA